MTARLILAPSPAEIARRLAPWLRMLSDAAAWPADLAFAVELCLDEVINNIAMHGDGATGDVAVEIDTNATPLLVSIEDGGAPFDPTPEPKPLAQSLDEAKIGGLGLVLIHRLSTRMSYERIGGRNRLTLWFDSKAGS
jgi:anti-sigma regulatory factor (Ser/Thr protein kinase)